MFRNQILTQGRNSIVLLSIIGTLGACSQSNNTPVAATINPKNISTSSKPVMGAVSSFAANGGAVTDVVNNISYDADAGTATINRATNDVNMTGAQSAGSNITKLEDSSGLTSALIIAQTTDGNGYAASYRDGDLARSNPEHSVLIGGASTTSAPLAGMYTGDYAGFGSQHGGGIPADGVITGNVSMTVAGSIVAPTVSGGITSRSSGLADVTFAALPVTGASFTGAVVPTTGFLGQPVTGTVSGTFFETDSQGQYADEVVGTLLLQGGACVPGGVSGGNCAIESGAFQAAN